MYSSVSESESNVEISFGVEKIYVDMDMDGCRRRACVRVGVPVKNNKHITKHRAWGSGRWSGYKVLFDTVDACCWARLA